MAGLVGGGWGGVGGEEGLTPWEDLRCSAGLRLGARYCIVYIITYVRCGPDQNRVCRLARQNTPLVLPQWHVKDPGQVTCYSKDAGSMLQLNKTAVYVCGCE